MFFLYLYFFSLLKSKSVFLVNGNLIEDLQIKIEMSQFNNAFSHYFNNPCSHDNLEKIQTTHSALIENFRNTNPDFVFTKVQNGTFFLPELNGTGENDISNILRYVMYFILFQTYEKNQFVTKFVEYYEKLKLLKDSKLKTFISIVKKFNLDLPQFFELIQVFFKYYSRYNPSDMNTQIQGEDYVITKVVINTDLNLKDNTNSNDYKNQIESILSFLGKYNIDFQNLDQVKLFIRCCFGQEEISEDLYNKINSDNTSVNHIWIWNHYICILEQQTLDDSTQTTYFAIKPTVTQVNFLLRLKKQKKNKEKKFENTLLYILIVNITQLDHKGYNCTEYSHLLDIEFIIEEKMLEEIQKYFISLSDSNSLQSIKDIKFVKNLTLKELIKKIDEKYNQIKNKSLFKSEKFQGQEFQELRKFFEKILKTI